MSKLTELNVRELSELFDGADPVARHDRGGVLKGFDAAKVIAQFVASGTVLYRPEDGRLYFEGRKTKWRISQSWG